MAAGEFADQQLYGFEAMNMGAIYNAQGLIMVGGVEVMSNVLYIVESAPL